MADQSHLDVLKQSVEAWNSLRERNPSMEPDLFEADLSGADLSEAKLSEEDPSYAKLAAAEVDRYGDVYGDFYRGVDLSKADLSYANLSGANLTGADLTRANLSEADLSYPRGSLVPLFGADLSKADLSYAKLSGARLSYANLAEAKLLVANLRDADLSYADLRDADLRNAHLASANFYKTRLSGVKLSRADLRDAHLFEADLSDRDLSEVTLSGANLWVANLSKSNLRNAKLSRANLTRADLSEADLFETDLSEANLAEADLSRANLSDAVLRHSSLVKTNLTGATLTGCSIYGISAWKLKLEGAKQQNLDVSDWREPAVMVDNLEVAQFIYLLLNNERIRQVIDTITSKVVLILGRFTSERKAVLEAIRDELRQRDYLPILFDFEKPAGRDLTETISTLAHMARFIIADITEAKSIPAELQAIVPTLPSVPVQPLLLAPEPEYALFQHISRFPWVLDTYYYANVDEVLASIEDKVITPAETKVRELRSES